MFKSTSRKVADLPVPIALLVNGRLALAVSMLANPKLVMRLFGMGEQHNAAPAFARMFGIRNGVLGLGLVNLASVRDPQRLVITNIVVDAVDAMAFIDAKRRGEFSTRSAVMSTGVALAAVAMGVLALPAVSRERH